MDLLGAMDGMGEPEVDGFEGLGFGTDSRLHLEVRCI